MSFCEIVMVLRLVLDWPVITVNMQLGSLVALLNFFNIRVGIFICLDTQCISPRMKKVTGDKVTY